MRFAVYSGNRVSSTENEPESPQNQAEPHQGVTVVDRAFGIRICLTWLELYDEDELQDICHMTLRLDNIRGGE